MNITGDVAPGIAHLRGLAQRGVLDQRGATRRIGDGRDSTMAVVGVAGGIALRIGGLVQITVGVVVEGRHLAVLALALAQEAAGVVDKGGAVVVNCP